MLLAIDIGNTNITIGVFNKEELVETIRLASDKEMSKAEYKSIISKLLSNYEINDCVIGSVVNELENVIKTVCDEVFNVTSLVISENQSYDFLSGVENPKEVGADRIANVSAVLEEYSLPAIVVDLGTATTFDVVTKDKKFIGGVIMPGLKLQLKSLSTNTSKLPKIELGESKNPIGNNTESCILSGVIRGSAGAIEGLINQCELQLGEKATIIATGGYSEMISKYMFRKFDYIKPDLTLRGLKILKKTHKMKVL